MKKILTTIITALTVCVIGAASVFAAGSSTGAAEVQGATDSNGNPVSYTVEDTTVPLITTDIASSLNSVASNELRVLWQKDLSVASLPVTFTFNLNGTDGQTLYVFHWNGSAWELITQGTGPVISATFTSLSPVAIVVKVPASSDGSSQAPATVPAAAAPVAEAAAPATESAPAEEVVAPAADDATTSPRTGDFTPVIASVAVILVATSATYIVASKKS